MATIKGWVHCQCLGPFYQTFPLSAVQATLAPIVGCPLDGASNLSIDHLPGGSHDDVEIMIECNEFTPQSHVHAIVDTGSKIWEVLAHASDMYAFTQSMRAALGLVPLA